MPTIYRSMLADRDRPIIGNAATALGVRLPPDPKPDVSVNADGTVSPRTGGMSVAPSWRHLPVWRIPRRLSTKFLDARGIQGASGSNNLVCWRLGEGPFAEAPIGDRLLFRPDPDRPDSHGFVEPLAQLPLTEYQAALANTRDQWQRDED